MPYPAHVALLHLVVLAEASTFDPQQCYLYKEQIPECYQWIPPMAVDHETDKFCDPVCELWGDCDSKCRPHAESAAGPMKCHCDSHCSQFDDCCDPESEAGKECSRNHLHGTCVNSCGQVTLSGCSCTDTCHWFGNCCYNFAQHCENFGKDTANPFYVGTVAPESGESESSESSTSRKTTAATTMTKATKAAKATKATTKTAATTTTKATKATTTAATTTISARRFVSLADTKQDTRESPTGHRPVVKSAKLVEPGATGGTKNKYYDHLDCLKDKECDSGEELVPEPREGFKRPIVGHRRRYQYLHSPFESAVLKMEGQYAKSLMEPVEDPAFLYKKPLYNAFKRQNLYHHRKNKEQRLALKEA